MSTPTSRQPGTEWLAWSTAWAGAVALAILNGALHRGYQGALGELRAQQASSVALLVLLAPWMRWVERRHPLPTTAAAVQVGLLWTGATVAFEFLFGHYVNRDSWSRLFSAYNLAKGQLWPLDLLGIAILPALARTWRTGHRPTEPGRS